jgi:hypothetical protein
MESQFRGPIAPTKYVEQESNYDPMNETIIKEHRKTVSEEFLTVLYLKNTNQKKYGSILQGLSTQQSLHTDQYPKTVIDANNVLSNHKFDNYKSQGRRSGKDREKSDKNSKDDKEDRDEQEAPISFAQLKGRCYCCGKPGHRSPDCQDKTRFPKKSGPSMRSNPASHIQASENANTNNNTSTRSQPQGNSNASQWAGVHLRFYQASTNVIMHSFGQ